jgi:hypothetical protein
MDGSTFDRLTRAVSSAGSRRRLLGLLTSVGLGGLLRQLDDGASEAKRHHGRNRGHHPGKHKRHRKGKRKGNGGGGGGVGGPGPCTANGGACNQNSDCCSETCFGQVCAAPVTTCGGVACPAGATGCCPNGGCCQSPANQCNGAGLCCAPNCGGRECGTDGCGNSGTCGSCRNGQTCNTQTGQCQGGQTCSPQNCPNGCCDDNGDCQPGTTVQACGTGGEVCAVCLHGQTCNGPNGQCEGQPTCDPESCPQGCCDTFAGTCQPGNNASFCGTGGAACVTCQPAQRCTQTGQCEDEYSCDSENCNGCCDPAPFVSGAVCRIGTSTAACGQDGQSCQVCRGSAAVCQGGLCECTPDCQNKTCGDDGCGGTCGTCAPNQFCLEQNDPTNWFCEDKCTTRNCPNGCCDATGTCQPGNTDAVCGTFGASCQACAGTCQGCFNGACAHRCDCGGSPDCSGISTCDVGPDFCCQPVDGVNTCSMESSGPPCCPPAICRITPMNGLTCCWPGGESPPDGNPMNCCSGGIDFNGHCCPRERCS